MIARYAFALTAGAFAALSHGRYNRAEQLCGQALDAAGEPNDEIQGRVAFVRATLARSTLDGTRAIALYEQALYYFRRFATPYHLVNLLNVLAVNRAGGGDLAMAAVEAQEALTIARRTGNPGVTSGALAGLAYVLAESEPERSRTLIAESLELNDRLGAIVVDELALVLTMVACAELGERDQVLTLAARALDRGLTSNYRLAVSLEVAAEALATPSPTAAAVLHGQADSLVPHLAHSAANRIHFGLRQRATAAIDAQLDLARVSELRAYGAALTQHEAVAYALDAIDRGREHDA